VDPITFRVVCQAIAKYAFCTTDLPLIVSLEIHCSIEQQKKMVEVCSCWISLIRFCKRNLESFC
jgi:hypothetical protein